MTIQFTQFLFPDAKKKIIHIDRDNEIEEKASDLIDEGFRFEIENNLGMIWATVIKEEDDEEITYDLVFKNDLNVPEKIDQLISESWDKFVWANL